MKTKELTYGALLSAMAVMIPLAFGGILMVNIQPFTATLLAHVPVFIAMLINPTVALMVGISSAIGFFVKVGAIAGARGLSHAVIGVIGAIMIKKGFKFSTTLVAIAPIHAILEALVVIPFAGYSLKYILIVVGLGTLIHHSIDSVISLSIIKVVEKALSFKSNKNISI